MRGSRAGGFIIAVAVLAGAFIGARQGQVTAGILLGLLIGAGIATVIWLIDRK